MLSAPTSTAPAASIRSIKVASRVDGFKSRLIFDPARVSYDTLLDAFFAMHDPTQVNRQGPDWGSQYRSVVFARSGEQMQQAKAKIDELNASGAYRKPIATKVEPATTFWKAEEYHQRYLEKRGMVSCQI